MEEEKELNSPAARTGIDLSSIRKYWNNLPRPAQIGVIAVASAAVVLIAVLVIINLTAPPMEVLFSELAPEQAQMCIRDSYYKKSGPCLKTRTRTGIVSRKT